MWCVVWMCFVFWCSSFHRVGFRNCFVFLDCIFFSLSHLIAYAVSSMYSMYLPLILLTVVVGFIACLNHSLPPTEYVSSPLSSSSSVALHRTRDGTTSSRWLILLTTTWCNCVQLRLATLACAIGSRAARVYSYRSISRRAPHMIICMIDIISAIRSDRELECISLRMQLGDLETISWDL